MFRINLIGCSTLNSAKTKLRQHNFAFPSVTSPLLLGPSCMRTRKHAGYFSDPLVFILGPGPLSKMFIIRNIHFKLSLGEKFEFKKDSQLASTQVHQSTMEGHQLTISTLIAVFRFTGGQ